MAPVVGASSPEIRRSSVDLPHPDGPSSATNEPEAMSSSMPSSARRSPPKTWRRACMTTELSMTRLPPNPSAPRITPAAPTNQAREFAIYAGVVDGAPRLDHDPRSAGQLHHRHLRRGG